MSMYSDDALMEKIIAFLEGVMIDLQINQAALSGEASLIREKCRSMDFPNIDEAFKDAERISHNTGYVAGRLKMASEIVKLIGDEYGD